MQGDLIMEFSVQQPGRICSVTNLVSTDASPVARKADVSSHVHIPYMLAPIRGGMLQASSLGNPQQLHTSKHMNKFDVCASLEFD